MGSTLSERIQAINEGALFRHMDSGLWVDWGKDRREASIDGVRVTLFDARKIVNKDSWRRPILPALEKARLVLLLGWGNGRGIAGLPRFNQEEAFRILQTIAYDPDAHAVLIFLTSKQLTDWLAFLGEHCLPNVDVWSLSAGKPARITWEAA